MQETVPVREYARLFLSRWWVVASVVAVVMVAAFLLSLRKTAQYEVQTKLLIIPRVSASLANGQFGNVQAESLGQTLSVETLSTLATARDLMRDIIAGLGLVDAATSEPWRVERLAPMLTPQVETGGRAGAPVALPVLTMRVHGEDRDLLEKIANKWTDLFIERNARLFSSEASRSYDFLQKQNERVKRESEALQSDHLNYSRDNPLGVLNSDLSTALATYQTLSRQLNESTSRLLAAQERQTYYGAVLSARKKAEKDLNEFQRLKLKEVAKAELNRLQGQYNSLYGQIDTKEYALLSSRTTLKALESALAAEPSVITVKRTIPNDTLFAAVAGGSTSGQITSAINIVVTEDQPNPQYAKLRADLTEARRQAEAYPIEIADLSSRLQSVVVGIKTRSAELLGLDLDEAQLNSAIAVLGSGIESSLAEANADVTALTSTVADYQKKVEALNLESRALADRIARIDAENARFAGEFGLLQTAASSLSERLFESDIARAEDSATIRVVEEAVAASEPIASGRLQYVILGAMAGLVLGVIAVFGIQLMKGPEDPARTAG